MAALREFPYTLSGTRMGQTVLALSACLSVGLVWALVVNPVVALAAGLAPLAVIVTLRQPFLLVLGFVIFSFFRIHEVFPQLYPLRIPQFLAIATLASLGWNVATGQMKAYWSRELSAFAVFFIIVTVGIVAATNRAEAFANFSGTFSKIGIMTLVIAWLTTGPREFRIAARAVVWAGLLVAAVALYNKAGGIGLVEGSRITIGRDIGSMLGDPNDLALVLLFPASFALALLLTRGSGWGAKLLGLLAFCMVFAAVIATQSRGGLLGITAVIGVFAWRRMKSKALLVTLGVVALVALFAMAGISGRESGGTLEEGIDESAMGRLYAWEAAFRMALAHPLTGVGIDNFLPNYFFYSVFWDGKNHAVHSTWFGVLAETGFLGFLIFSVMIGVTVRSAMTAVRALAPEEGQREVHDPDSDAMAQALLAGLVGFLVSGTFLTMGFTWPFYVLLALTVAVSRYARSSQNTIQPER